MTEMETASPVQTAAPDHRRLQHYLDGVKTLPPTPALMIKLIDLFRRPDRDADEIVALIQRDPALAAEVLRRCKKSFFGTGTPVADIHEAVFRLGFYEVYRITIGLFGIRAQALKNNPCNFPVEAWREHSHLTGIAAGLVAREVAEPEGMVFITGLLHDIGKIILAGAEGPQYASMVAAHGSHGDALAQAETAVFGFNHGHIGSLLLSRWGIADQVTVPVWEHHCLTWSGTHGKIAAILQLTDLLAHHIQDSTSGVFSEQSEVRPVIEFLKLDIEQTTTLEVMVRTQLKQMPPLTV